MSERTGRYRLTGDADPVLDDPGVHDPPRVVRSPRIQGVDAARAVALVGMFATHVLAVRGPDEERTLTGLLAPRGHEVFPGRLEPTRLSAPERAVATAMRAPVGDFRDWDAVRTWAAEIATALTGAALPADEATR